MEDGSAGRARAWTSSGLSSAMAVDTTSSAPAGGGWSWPGARLDPRLAQARRVRGLGAVRAGDLGPELARPPARGRSCRRRRCPRSAACVPRRVPPPWRRTLDPASELSSWTSGRSRASERWLGRDFRVTLASRPESRVAPSAHAVVPSKLKSLAAILSRFPAHIRLATAKAVVPVAVAGLILIGSQLVLAAAPTADFGLSPSVGRVGQPVSFSATASDEDDDIVSVDWDFENDGGVDARRRRPAHLLELGHADRPDDGDRRDRRDRRGDHTIRVNSPPNAAFDHSPANPTVGRERQLRRLRLDRRRGARRRRLRLGPRQRRRLRRRDRAPGRPLASPPPARRPCGLRVTDSEGEHVHDSDSVSVGPANSAPRRPSTSAPTRPNPNQGGGLRRLGRHATTGRFCPTDYAWDLDGDGQYDDAIGATPTTSYPSGTRTVSLRVTDMLGVTDTASHTVTVNAPPTASFAFTPSCPEVGQTVTFDVRRSDDDLPALERRVRLGLRQQRVDRRDRRAGPARSPPRASRPCGSRSPIPVGSPRAPPAT